MISDSGTFTYSLPVTAIGILWFTKAWLLWKATLGRNGNEGTCLTSRLGETFSSPNAVNYDTGVENSYERSAWTASGGLPITARVPFETTGRSIKMG